MHPTIAIGQPERTVERRCILMTCMETPESVAADLAFSALFFV
jgi:hypothetical protein